MEQNSTGSKLVNSWLLPHAEVEWEELEQQWKDDGLNDGFIQQVKRGRSGLNIGMSNGLTAINKYLHGTHRGRYYLIGADSGVGKTTLCDFMYLFSLWMACKLQGVKIKVIYFSFEISAVQKKARWVSQWIKRVYNIDLSVDYIMGYIADCPVTEEHYKMIVRGYSLVQEMMQDIYIVDHLLHPTGMLHTVLDYHEQNGKIIRDQPKEGKKQGMIRSYIPKDPAALTVVITDHVALINQEAGAISTKESIDRWSMYSVQLRNIFGDIIVNIQQFSVNMQNASREKKSPVQLTPQRLDFGDSTYTYRDADVVLGMVKPINAGLDTFFGYDLRVLKSYFLAVYLLKNRYGPADKIIPVFMNPVAGMFWDMPESTSPNIQHFHEEAKRLNSI